MGKLLIPTNCQAIDELLGGGLEGGTLLLIYGEAETGKTTLALQLAVSCAGMGHKALFVDCEGTLRAEKVEALAGGDPEILEKLVIARPESFEQQGELIDRLEQFARAGLRMVVIDTITGLYRRELAGGAAAFALNRELTRQVATLAQVVHEHELAAVMTSQVRARPEAEEVEPVANRVLKFWADVVLRLKLTGQPGLRIAELEKGPRPVGPPARFFRIAEEGIVDAL